MKNNGMNHIPAVKGHVFNLTVNLIAVAIFYTFLGGTVSWALSGIFPSFDEKWKRSSLFYQMADVAMEVSVVIIVAFWLTYFVHIQIPILPVSSALEHYVESFGGQMIFIYAVFIFMDTLDDKLIAVFKKIFAG